MKKIFKNILAVAGVLGLTFALNAVKPQHVSAAENLPSTVRGESVCRWPDILRTHR